MNPLRLLISVSAFALMGAAATAGITASNTNVKAGANPHGEYIQFSIDHADSKKGLVHGGFSNFSQVSGKVDMKNLAASKAVFHVDIASIKTGIGKRDGHLKTGDFFNVAKWAKASITVDKVRKAKKGDVHKARVTLGIRDVKKSFDVDFKVVKAIKGGLLVEGTTSLNRRDYGVGAEPAKTGAAEKAAIKVRLAVINK